MTTASFVTDLIRQSLVLEQAGEVSMAFQQAKRAFDQACTLKQPAVIAAAQVCLATVYFRTGHYVEATAFASEVLSVAPDKSTVCADALIILGNCAAETHSLIEAETYFHRAANLSRLIGYPLAQLRSLHGLGQGVYLPRGQFDLALAAEQEVWRIAQDEAWHSWRPFPLTTIAWVYQLTDRSQLARETLQQLSTVIVPQTLHQGYHDYLLASVEQDEGHYAEAQALLIQARSVAEAIGEPGLSVLIRLGFSRYDRAARKFAEAHHWADDAVDRATRSNYQHLRGLSLIERARTSWLLQETAAADTDLRLALEVLTPLQAHFDLARAYVLLAALQYEQHQPDAARLWREALTRISRGGYAFLLEQERALAFPLLAQSLNDDTPDMINLAVPLLEHLKRVPPPPLTVVTLGRFEVWQHGQSIADREWNQRKAGELFRLLLVTPDQTLTRDQIIEALWPDKSVAQALPLLHRATSTLRRVLEPDLPDKFPSRYLEVEEGRVTLHVPIDSRLDFEQFEQQVKDQQWPAALASYGGELFPADRYADWAAVPRERFAQLYVQALLAQAQLDLDAAQFDWALELARRVIVIEPWHEQAVLIAIQASLAKNDRPGAARLYHTLEQTLRADLGLSPMPELRTLYQTLLIP